MLYRNSLPVKARLAGRYRDENIDQECNLCTDINSTRVPDRETFVHIFWHCGYTSSIYNALVNNYYPTLDMNTFKQQLFFGRCGNETSTVVVLQSVLLLFEIWRARNMVKKISFATIERNMVHNMTAMMLCNKNIKDMVYSIDDSWCRTWWPGEQHWRG
jgi:hypothetical protein